MTKANDLEILLVEDNPGDVAIVRWALGDCIKDPGALRVMRDGRAAFDFVNDESLPTRMLVLLDLNLPGRHGFEILEAIQGIPAARARVRTIVWSSSRHGSDRERALALGASQYISKPYDLAGLDALHDSLCGCLREFEEGAAH